MTRAVGRRAPLPTTYDATLRDPANGAKVPRCAICGMPDQEGARLLPGLWAYVRLSFELTLCERCVIRHRRFEPQDADPMQLHDAA